jgi:hypothetical protein
MGAPRRTTALGQERPFAGDPLRAISGRLSNATAIANVPGSVIAEEPVLWINSTGVVELFVISPAQAGEKGIRVARSKNGPNANPTLTHQSETIAQIIDDIEQGRDLTKYLSRRVAIGFDLPSAKGKKNLAKQRHLDLLLNDWGIHHLHVSTTLNQTDL